MLELIKIFGVYYLGLLFSLIFASVGTLAMVFSLPFSLIRRGKESLQGFSRETAEAADWYLLIYALAPLPLPPNNMWRHLIKFLVPITMSLINFTIIIKNSGIVPAILLFKRYLIGMSAQFALDGETSPLFFNQTQTQRPLILETNHSLILKINEMGFQGFSPLRPDEISQYKQMDHSKEKMAELERYEAYIKGTCPLSGKAYRNRENPKWISLRTKTRLEDGPSHEHYTTFSKNALADYVYSEEQKGSQACHPKSFVQVPMPILAEHMNQGFPLFIQDFVYAVRASILEAKQKSPCVAPESRRAFVPEAKLANLSFKLSPKRADNVHNARESQGDYEAPSLR